MLARLLLATLATRVLFLLIAPPDAVSVDLLHWRQVAHLIETGRNPYNVTTYLNWPPVWMQLLFAFAKLQAVTGISFSHIVQGFLIGVELLTVACVWFVGIRVASPVALRNALGVAIVLNPIPVFLVCQHANFDVLVGLWVVLFLGALLRFRETGNPTDWLVAAFFLGLGILTKTVPFVLTPLLLVRIDRVPLASRCLGLAHLLLPVALGLSILYVLGPEPVTRNVLAYRSFEGWFGISGLLYLLDARSLATAYTSGFPFVLVAALVWIGVRLSRARDLASEDLLRLAGLLLLAIITLGPGYGPQYLYWALPIFALLYAVADGVGDRVWKIASILTLGIASLTYGIEYLFLPSHGALYLHWATPDAAALRWLEDLATRSGQITLRLPLFAAYLGVLGLGATRGFTARRN